MVGSQFFFREPNINYPKSLDYAMLTTKNTYIYRGLGALGCGLVLLGIFLPWAAITDGKIGPFPSGAAPSGWDLAYKQQLSGSTLNIGGAIFSAVFGMIIFAILGIIVMANGRNGASFGYFLIASSVFFLVFMLALLPYVQQSIPAPPDPMSPDKLAALDALNATDPAEGSRQWAELNKLDEQRETVLQWKNLTMVPQAGFAISLIGAVMGYVFARFIVADAARLENFRKYQTLLTQVHSDGKVTTDEAAILARERQMLKISQAEHEFIIRHAVTDAAAQQRFLAMHNAPIDVEHVMRSREFDTYKRSLVQAYKDGRLTQDESDLLRTQREGLGITEADHDAMLEELVMSGEITISTPKNQGPPIAPPVPAREGGPSAQSSKSAPPPPPKTPAVAAMPTSEMPQLPPPATPLPSKPTLYASPSPAARPEPGPKAPVSLLSAAPGPAPPPPPPVPVQPAPAPEPSGPGSAALPPSIPPPEGPPKEPVKRVKCTKCGETIPIYTEDRPLELVCPKCGFRGMLRR